MTELCVDVVREPAVFLAMAREWDALVERAGIDHPFLAHDWVRTWWECFGAGNELHVLTVRSEGVLIGVAPLMRTRARVLGIPVRRLEFIANVHTPRFDFIVAERAPAVYAALLDALLASGPGWDVLMLAELSGRSQTEPELKRLVEARSLRTGVWVAGASPRIPLRGTFEGFQASLPSKRRRSLRQRRRRLEALGPVSQDVVTNVERLAGALQDGLRIEAAAWKGEAGTAIGGNAATERFYALVAERAARSGILRLLFLRVGDKRIAFGYCLCWGRTLYLLKTGYDPEYAAFSPFNALMLGTIESAFREGLETFDLLGCDEPWKREWADAAIERRWLFVCGNTPRGRFVHHWKFVLLPWLRSARARARPTLAAGQA